MLVRASLVTTKMASPSSLRSTLEACSRGVRTVVFILNLVASLLVPPVVLSIVDVVLPCILVVLLRSPSIFKASDMRHYSFRSSVLDILALSALRSICLVAVYTVGGGARCVAYFSLALLVGLVSVPYSTVKACFQLSSITSPSRCSWALVFIYISSITCALGHVVIAYKTRCQAKRKYLRNNDEELGFLKKYTSKLKQKRGKRSSGKFDKDEEHPIYALTDINSRFMPCEGLQLHYKIFEPRPLQDKENENPKKWQLTRTGSSPLPSMRSLREADYNNPSSLRTPLLSVTRQNSVGLPSKFGLNSGELKPFVVDIESPRPTSDRKGAILIHGFGGGVFSWRHIMGPLSRQSGYNVASFDRPGWGLTTRTSSITTQPNPYDLESQVDLLIGFCHKIGFRSVVLVGHDDGGLLALMTAAKASQQATPIQVQGVVLIGVSLSRDIVPAFARVLLHTSLGRHMLRPLLCSDVTARTNRGTWHDASKLTSQVMDLYKAPLQSWEQAFVDARQSWQSHLSPELLDKVKNLPVLLVAGMQDMLVPLQAVESLASQLPKSKLVAIPRCGHLPPEECPGALLAALVPFMTDLLGF